MQLLTGSIQVDTINMSLEQILARLSAANLPLQTKLDQLRAEFKTNLAPPDIVAA